MKNVTTKIKGTRNATRCNNCDNMFHLASLQKFQYFKRAIYNQITSMMELYYKNSKLLSTFTKKLYCQC